MYTQLASNHSLSQFLQPSTISHHHHNMYVKHHNIHKYIYTHLYTQPTWPNDPSSPHNHPHAH